jgi:hypothetical protein
MLGRPQSPQPQVDWVEAPTGTKRPIDAAGETAKVWWGASPPSPRAKASVKSAGRAIDTLDAGGVGCDADEGLVVVLNEQEE